MSPEERNLLNRFLDDLGRSRGGLKDAEAAAVIDRAVGSNPDAAYLLVQHAILSDQALHAAQAQIADLQAQLQGAGGPAQAQGGFLGGGGPWSRPQAQSPQYSPQAPPPQQPQGLFGGGPAAPGGFGSFLRSAGTTAAGVAGGAFLFDSLSGLFGGHHGMGGFGGGFGGGGWGGAPVENVTINEYGDQPGDGGSYDDGSGSDFSDDGGYDDGGVN